MNELISNKLTFYKIFPCEIIEIILELKKILEFIDTKNEYIERDFYNMLTYDICHRSNLYLCPVYKYFYNKYYEDLGLVKYDDKDGHSLRRTISLHKLFKTKWWKTTEKSSPNWLLIHSIIKDSSFIKIDRMGDLTNWKLPTLKEKLKVLRNINHESLMVLFSWWLNRGEPIYINECSIIL